MPIFSKIFMREKNILKRRSKEPKKKEKKQIIFKIRLSIK
jgi:hypothetical protein